MRHADDGSLVGLVRRAPLAALVLAAAPLLSGCFPIARWYAPREAHPVREPSLEYEPSEIHVLDGGQLDVQAKLHVSGSDYAIGPPRLSRPDLEPCASGELPSAWLYVEAKGQPDSPLNGVLSASFLKNERARALLTNGPTTLDVPLVPARGHDTRCLRVALLSAPASTPAPPEWVQDPSVWLGGSLHGMIPTRPIRGSGGALLGTLAFGPFVGPFRLGAELTLGSGFEARHAAPANHGTYNLYGVGFTLDSPPLTIGRFGLGAKLGFDSLWLSFQRSPHDDNDRPVSRGALYGPRMGIRFAFLPQTPLSSAYRARPDAWSTGLELSGSTLFHEGAASPTPAVNISYFGDIGF